MSKTDFIDRDLVYRRNRQGGGPPSEDGEVPARAISDISLSRMARHKEEISAGVVSTINELETLRRREQELEEEKRSLEDMIGKQEQYETGRREIIEHLNEGIVALEKKEIQSAQLTDLLVATRNRFKDLLDEIERIDETQWEDAKFRQELFKALVIVDDARMEYNKALAKIQVLEGRGETIIGRNELQQIAAPGSELPRGFFFWLKVGFALCAAFTATATAILGGFLLFRFLLSDLR